MRNRFSELQILENYRVAFQNVIEQTEIKDEMEAYGYDADKINEGKALYDAAVRLFGQNRQETEEEKQAYAHFSKAFTKATEQYRKHRKAVKVALLKNDELANAFRVKKPEAQAYLQWMDDAEVFYNEIKKETPIKAQLTLFKVTDAVAQQQLEQLSLIRDLRAKYEKEKGESQQATKDKNAAFKAITEWMRTFYAVARIALDERPQLLESIAKFVRS